MQINDENDLIAARKLVRDAAVSVGFGLTDTTRLVTAASELARNVLQHAGGGAMQCSRFGDYSGSGIEVIFIDEGPGIVDVEVAMQPGFSTSHVPSLGLGLPGTRRLVDEMDVTSLAGQGTTVKIRKWVKRKQSY
jgi:serine/threonine-protein kinase RsbT